jgi:thiol-disulfide isomerase/thioredoxin
MHTRLVLLCPVLLAMTSSCSPSDVDRTADLLGSWDAALASPGGRLAFGVDISQGADGLSAHLVNGEERIPVPRVVLRGSELVLGMDHYDSEIVARLEVMPTTDLLDDGRRLEGTWTKRRGLEEYTTMAFSGRPADPLAEPPPPPNGSATGRYRVQFESDAQPAVGVFEVGGIGTARGTFMTTTGDYRYLAGFQSDGLLELSCFDGAHAFLFRAELQDDGSLAGDFWSREAWHETWTAVRDDSASLPDGFGLTKWTDDGSLADLAFPDLDGVTRSLDDPAFAGKARMLQVFGSWCPNCHDACAFLSELHETYGDRGLSVLGLAFELTGDFERDASQVRRYAERHGVTYPLLVAGLADKAAAGEVLPVLDAVRSYPTTVFLHGDGRVRAVYQGFSGPATGDAHDELRAAFTAIIEELLAEGDAG